MKSKKIRKQIIVLLFCFLFLVGCKDTSKEEVPSLPTAEETKTEETSSKNIEPTSINTFDLSSKDIVFVRIDSHYGENDTDAWMIEFLAENEAYSMRYLDYASLEMYNRELLKGDFDKLIEEVVKLSTVRTYEHAPSKVWSFVTVETSNGESFFFNDQTEVGWLIDWVKREYLQE